MTTEAIVIDAAGRVRRQSDAPGASDRIVFYQGRAQPLSVAGVPLGSTDPMVVDDTDPERVRRYSQTDEASAPPPPPPPPPPPAATWNPEDKGPDITLSNGNLTATNSTANWEQVRSTTSKTDKRYFEVTINVSGSGLAIGVCNAALAMNGFWAGSTDGVFNNVDAQIYYNFPGTVGVFPWVAGDVIGCAYDPAGTVKYNKNGGAFTADLAVPGIGGTFFAMISTNGAGAQATANFAPASPPAGYTAWNS